MATWRCPYCNQVATLTGTNVSFDLHVFDNNNVDGRSTLYTRVQVCPNEDCRQYVIDATLFSSNLKPGTTSKEEFKFPARLTWELKPRSQAKPLPDYIPAVIRTDYEEACLISKLSPKASATLSRRCLQGMIRDFHGIVGKRLFDEIAALQERTDLETWSAIDAVRKIGNIGAHMEKDINEIVDVEPREADLLIELIETLLTEWYELRHARQVRMAAIVEAAAAKS